MNDNIIRPSKSQSSASQALVSLDFKLIRALVIVNWHWFVFSILTCALIGALYLWFTPTDVCVTGKMEIVDKSQNSSSLSAGMAMLNSLPMGLGSAIGGGLGGSLGIDSEKEIITSNTLVRNVVKDLGLYTEYRLCRWGRKTLLYKDRPINVSLDQAHVEWLDSELPLNYHRIELTVTKNSKGYVVETKFKDNNVKSILPEQTFASLPAVIKTKSGTLTISENLTLTDKQREAYTGDYSVRVVVNPPKEIADVFISKLTVAPPSKKISNILAITLKDENLMLSIDFINHLVEAYNKRANDEKNEEARKTDEFVNERLAKIDSELGSSDAAWENSKKNFQIADPEVDAQEVMTKKSLYESKLVEIGTELQLHDYLSEYVHNPDNLYELIPVGFNGGMGDLSGDVSSKESSSNASLIAQHNTLVSQRNQLLRSMSDKAPQIQRLSEAIKELHPSLLTAMKRDRQNIIMKRNAVEREYSKYMGRVSTAPKMERVLTEIGRQREIKQGVYLLMLQKREETAMELANTTDKGRLIDDTSLERGSEKPKKKVVIILALFMGLLFPVGCLYIYLMLRSKIEIPSDIKNVSDRPTIGEITLTQNDEAIRTLRSNLLQKLKEDQKVVMIASNADGDGKTYLAKQLTDSLTAIGKKALYLNADLRSLSVPKGQHPADILASTDFANQIETAKVDNDFVIIDTPALDKYNDACQIATFADVALFVVKAGSTNKSVIEKLKSKSFPQLMYVLNFIDMSKKKNQYLFMK